MRDKGGEPDEKVFQRISEVSGKVSIDDALKIWLSRTPIYGSLQGDIGDESLVNRFVDNYLKVASFWRLSNVAHLIYIICAIGTLVVQAYEVAAAEALQVCQELNNE